MWQLKSQAESVQKKPRQALIWIKARISAAA